MGAMHRLNKAKNGNAINMPLQDAHPFSIKIDE